MRAFLAVELPAAVKASLCSAGACLRRHDKAWVGEKWVAAEAMHVTLRFLGDVDESSLTTFSNEFARLASHISAFDLRVAGLKAVPSANRASMIWAVVADESGGCRQLARIAENAAIVIGLPASSRAFSPHVTLVRARRARRVAPAALELCLPPTTLAEWPPVSVLSATLFSSTLTPRGPLHEPLERFDLWVGKR